MIEQSRRLLQVEDITPGVTEEVTSVTEDITNVTEDVTSVAEKSNSPSTASLTSSAKNKSNDISATNQNAPCQFMQSHAISDLKNEPIVQRRLANQTCDRWIHRRDIQSAPAELIRRRQKLTLNQRMDIAARIIEVCKDLACLDNLCCWIPPPPPQQSLSCQASKV